MNRHLETTQFLVLVRTQRFLDSRSPFVDVTTVAYQREQRKNEQKLQLAEQKFEEQKRREKEEKSGATSTSRPASGRREMTTTESGEYQEDGGGEDEDDTEGKSKKPTTQQLLSPAALFGDFCIVYGVSGVCEHLLRVYENEILAERSKKNMNAKKKQIKNTNKKNKTGDDSDKTKNTGEGKNSANDDEKDSSASNIIVNYDEQFEDPENDLSTTYPLQGVPVHFQYDGGILIDFLENLPLISVFELSTGDGGGADFGSASSSRSHNKGGGGNSSLNEPRYVPRGLLWIKSQLLNYLELRAKKIEVPK